MDKAFHLNEKVQILKQAKLFEVLDAEALDMLASKIVDRSLTSGEILFLAGDPADGLYVIAEGSVRAFRSGSDGREQVIHVERSVTTIAEVPMFDGGAYPSTVAAEEDSRVYFIPKDEIRAVCMSHPQLALAAARLLALRLRHCAELVELLSLREVGQRIAQFLIEEARTRGRQEMGSITFVQRLTHNQLAARIGTVREVVTRSLTKLNAAGLVKVDGKKVTIPDIQNLELYAGL